MEAYRFIRPLQTAFFDVDEPSLRFVIRRHFATNLHWDFRIEANGVLYSWFMRQAPTADPARPVSAGLADPHNPRYLETERFINPGNPGAGPTIVEDRGKVKPLVQGYTSQELALHECFLNGRIPLRMEGVVLKGAYVMELTIREWQFRKLEDDFATAIPLNWSGISPISGLTLRDLVPRNVKRVGKTWVYG